MTCPDCGASVVEAIGSLSRKPQLYEPRRGGNLVLDEAGVMVAVDRVSGHPVAAITSPRRFVLHSTICPEVALEVGMDALADWHSFDRMETVA